MPDGVARPLTACGSRWGHHQSGGGHGTDTKAHCWKVRRKRPHGITRDVTVPDAPPRDDDIRRPNERAADVPGIRIGGLGPRSLRVESGTRSLCSAPPGYPRRGSGLCFPGSPREGGYPPRKRPSPGGAGGVRSFGRPDSTRRRYRWQRHPRSSNPTPASRPPWLRRMHDGGEHRGRTEWACPSAARSGRGHRDDRDAVDLVLDSLAALADVRECLWPVNPDAEWSPDTIDGIARRLAFLGRLPTHQG